MPSAPPAKRLIDRIDPTIAYIRRLREGDTYEGSPVDLRPILDALEELACQLRTLANDFDNHAHGYRWEKINR